MRAKTIRVSEEEYKMIEKAKEEIMRKGTEALPAPLKTCPHCDIPMDMVGIEYHYYQCPQCSFKEQDLRVTTAGSFTLGALVGLGAAALLYLLLHEEGNKKNLTLPSSA
jgi:uncharacterized paraquat-inducible protein A